MYVDIMCGVDLEMGYERWWMEEKGRWDIIRGDNGWCR